ncbi:maleylpyruvate isomerase family mycothiol-dependent enzyme [Actinoplanes sp. NPDC051346]|uniref:maleylpyruvate isomerase family mycothiol-dependent enzyme n=1 Tax=Actinoplanes sp. NPDC051346 TaxID=3155048 RepID=UPI003421B30D
MTGTDAHQAVAQLLGAWALQACSPLEDSVVRAHLHGCAACAAEARALRAAVEALDRECLPPPATTIAPLGVAANALRRPAPPAPPYAAPYAAQVAALDLMLSGLAADDWDRVAAYGEWSVHDLLIHLTATDGLIASALGLTVEPPVEPGDDPVSRTRAMLDVLRNRSTEDTRRSWRAQADAVCRTLLRHPSLAAGTVVLGLPLTVRDALVARAFETWIHIEDIAAAAARPSVTPLPEHVHLMADLAARMLPHVIARRAVTPAGRQVRLHLTGPGGGTWTVPAAPPATALRASTGPVELVPSAEVIVEIVEFCRLVGGRREPERIGAELRGDPVLARELLAAAPGLSGP